MSLLWWRRRKPGRKQPQKASRASDPWAGRWRPMLEALENRTLPSAASPISAPIAQAYGQIPLSFEANQGQTASQVQFLSHGSGYTLFLTSQEAVLSLIAPAATSTPGVPSMPPAASVPPAAGNASGASQPATGDVLEMQLVGA